MTERWPSTATLFLSQTRYQIVLAVRSPVGVFFTLVLPLVMLILFNLLFGGETIDTDTGSYSAAQFYTGGLAAFTAVSATFTSLVNTVPIRRDEGVLKRWRSTPMPTSVHIAGWIASAVSLAVVGVILQLFVGVVFYGVDLEAAKLPAMIVSFIVGVAAFAAMGLAVASAVPNADSAPAVANALVLPLAFVSDIFIATEMPGWLQTVAGIFPLKPFANAFQNTLIPFVDAPAFSWNELAVVAAWGAVSAVIARATFRWEPATSGSPRRRPRSPRSAL